jgi:hypothetical protein
MSGEVFSNMRQWERVHGTRVDEDLQGADTNYTSICHLPVLKMANTKMPYKSFRPHYDFQSRFQRAFSRQWFRMVIPRRTFA